MTRLGTALAIAAAALAAAAPAGAAVTPDRSFSFDVNAAKFEWDGGPAFGVLLTSAVAQKVGCNAAVYNCDWTKVTLAAPGTLSVTMAGTSQTNVDSDLHLYDSNANGDPDPGSSEGDSTSFGPDEAVAADLAPGVYWVLVDSFTSVAGTYHGTAEFTPAGGTA